MRKKVGVSLATILTFTEMIMASSFIVGAATSLPVSGLSEDQLFPFFDPASLKVSLSLTTVDF